MRIIRIEKNTYSWFAPFFPERDRKKFEQGADMVAYGAVVQQTACGIIICYREKDTLDIEYIAVGEHYRRRGIATELVRALARRNPEINTITATLMTDQTPEPLEKFFRSLPDFYWDEDKSNVYCLLQETLKQIKIPEKKTDIMPFFNLTKPEIQQFIRQMLNQGENIISDFWTEPHHFRKELSFCSLDEKQQVSACILVEEVDNGNLNLYFAYSRENSVLALLYMIVQLRAQLLAQEKEALYISCVNQKSEQLFSYLIPDMEPQKKVCRIVNYPADTRKMHLIQKRRK